MAKNVGISFHGANSTRSFCSDATGEILIAVGQCAGLTCANRAEFARFARSKPLMMVVVISHASPA